MKQLAAHKHVYLAFPANATPLVVKLLFADYPYPWGLHEEMAQAGIAPKLVAPLSMYVGGVQAVHMEHLSQANGWCCLRDFDGDWDAVLELCLSALEQMQQCLDSCAVHGDLLAPNIMIRCASAYHDQVAQPVQLCDAKW